MGDGGGARFILAAVGRSAWMRKNAEKEKKVGCGFFIILGAGGESASRTKGVRCHFGGETVRSAYVNLHM